MAPREVTYDRPVKASLHVHLENGETWQATLEDLAHWGLDYRHDTYMRFRRALVAALERQDLMPRDLTDALLNPVRYLAEVAICYPESLDDEDNNGWSEVAQIERVLKNVHAAEVS